MPRQPDLHEPLHEPLHQPLRQALPDFSQMSDDELLVFVAGQEGGSKFEIPYGLEPEGMTYSWKRSEVWSGKPGITLLLLTLRQRGGRLSQMDAIRGRWMPPETDANAPITTDGLVLMELPTPLVEAKKRYWQKIARSEVDNLQETLTY